MRLKKWVALGVVLPVLGIGALAFADPPGGGMGPGPQHVRSHHEGPPYGYIVSQLDLTPKQQQMVDDWRTKLRSHFEQMRTERQQTRETVQAQFASGNPDPAVLHDLITQRTTEREQAAHDQLDAFLQLYATLTPDQKETVKELLDQGPPGRPMGRFRGQGRPGPGFQADRKGN